MFRHLDDPAPPAPDGPQRRAAQLRCERRRRWASTAVAVSLCSALLATALLTLHTQSPSVSVRETAYQFNQAVHLRVGTPVPTTALTDVVFVDESDGFGLATHRNDLVLAATTARGFGSQ